MKLTKEELDELLKFKDKPDNDNIRFKNIIKEKLLENRKILYLLNNKQLEKLDAPPDEYFNTNIFPVYMIDSTQTDSQNFICYSTRFDELDRYNPNIRHAQIVFNILCDSSTIIERNTGLARHDLIAAVLLEEFNKTNIFGMQVSNSSDSEGVVDSKYALRTLTLELETPNALVKTRAGRTSYTGI